MRHFAHRAGIDDFECGRRSVLGKEVIANGTDATARNWPWLALILRRDTDNKDKIRNKYYGNIISRTAVLTCAHCVYRHEKRVDANKLLVQAGTSKHTEPGTFNEIGRQILPVERVFVHPGYKLPKEPSFDLAILLVNKLVFTEYVQPICVWGPLYDKTELFGQQAVIASFKANNPAMFGMQVSNELVRSDDTCIAYAPTFADDLNEFNFCHGDISGKNPKISLGGSGVALAVTQDDNSVTWYLHGVASLCASKQGGGCDPKKLTLHTYVAPHYPWIQHHAFSN